MEANPNHFETLLSQAGDYATTKAQLFKLKIADKASDTVSDAASTIVVLLLVCFFMLCASIGVALWLGELLGKNYYGFFVVTGLYGIAGIIIHFNKKSLVKTPVTNFIISKILNPRP